ncbi:MAG: hypothetical protein ABMA13_03980 [Chthoniobacteraceae bacterium]
MKLFSSLSILTAIAVIVPTATFAAEKKAPKKEGAAPAAEAKKPAAEGAATKPIAMNNRVDSIDVAAKSFVTKRKDGYDVKHVLSPTAEVKNAGAAAKFEDIKVGDTVAGSRIKKSETEYEVVKITKFGPAAPRAAKEGAKKPAAEGEKKPAAKKADAKKE